MRRNPLVWGQWEREDVTRRSLLRIGESFYVWVLTPFRVTTPR